MSDAQTRPPSSLLAMTAAIISSHAEANPINAAALPSLIHDVYQALAGVDTPATPEETRKAPAVPIKRSILPDYIICLEDGQKLKMLKRYIQKRFGLTPHQYRQRWGLPGDYPMVAPAYSERRSAIATQFSLGRRKQAAGSVGMRRMPAGKRGGRRNASKPAPE